MTEPTVSPNVSEVIAAPAVPWYQSPVIRAFVTVLVTQLVAAAARKWKFDISAYGLDVNSLVEWVMNAIALGAVTWGVHARATTSRAPITLTQAKADAINATTTVIITKDPPK